MFRAVTPAARHAGGLAVAVTGVQRHLGAYASQAARRAQRASYHSAPPHFPSHTMGPQPLPHVPHPTPHPGAEQEHATAQGGPAAFHAPPPHYPAYTPYSAYQSPTPVYAPPMPPPPPPPPHYYGSPVSGMWPPHGAMDTPPQILNIQRSPPSRLERIMTLVHLVGGLLSVAFFGTMLWNMVVLSSQKPDQMPGGGFSGGSGGPFGNKNKVEPIKPENIEERFADVLGCDEAKAELEEVIDFLRDPDRFKAVGGRMPKGALLAGPPGTGKTMLARALAKEAGVPFFYMSGAEFEEVFVGVGARRVRDLFEAARSAAPALIFIDEIDAIGGSRRDGAGEANGGAGRATLNQLLTEMDGFKSIDGIFMLAATNTPKTLDKALMRPGRFDRTVTVDPPDQRGRAQILERYLRDVKCNADCPEPETFARTLPGMTGADLKNVVNIAAVAAARRGAAAVTRADMEAARDRVQLGAERRTHVVPDAERRLTAWHEAGHALVALLSGASDPVHKATIVPRGNGVAGLVLQLPPDDRQSVTRRQMRARLRVALAGRAGEEALCGDEDITAGAASDYQQATSLARNMVRRFGMADGALGAVDWASSQDAEGAYLSDATKARIEQETQALVDGALREAREMIRSHRPLLDTIAEQLLARDTLSGEELTALVQSHGASPGALEPLPPVQFELNASDTLRRTATQGVARAQGAAQGVADGLAAAAAGAAAAGIIPQHSSTTAPDA